MFLLTLFAGLLLSGTAAYYSIIGLLAIFPGAIIPITIMGTSLEFAKLVAASWLYRNWGKAPAIIKSYFIFAVFVLMFITSLGTFGYLSKVHLETSTSVADNSLEIARYEAEIATENSIIQNAQISLDLLNKLVAENKDPDAANRIKNRQAAERTALNDAIANGYEKISEINALIAPLKKTNLQAEAEIGPLKYVAELIYGQEATLHFDSAVRFVIILIVLVFDPLAVLLLIAANISVAKEEVVEPKVVDKQANTRYNKRGKERGVYKFSAKEDFGMKAVDNIENTTDK